MAQGKKSATIKIVQNNLPATLVSAIVDLVVVNDQLVADPSQVNPGVNSATNKN